VSRTKPAPDHDTIRRTVLADGLDIMGGLHEGSGTLILLGPVPAFWPILQHSPEMADGTPDPVDRWSRRVVTRLADSLGAVPLFPFGGLPRQPFLAWAVASGRAWPSPVGMLVHDTAGLMISYRGALRFDARIALPDPPAQSPCVTCADRPCRAACPTAAFSDAGYDVATCHGWLDTPGGTDCMTAGCLARRACPVSQRFGRDPAQSALHMRAFHPA
jgi:hypothetical protein